MKIFVTVGSAFQAFERLLRMVDSAVQSSSEPIEGLSQVGHSQTVPARLGVVRLMNRDEFERHVAAADVVICHGGVGALATACMAGHVPIALARRASLGEHVNDHQREVVAELARSGRLLDAEDGITDALLLRACAARRSSLAAAPDLAPVASALQRPRRVGGWRAWPLGLLAACAPSPSRLR